MNAKTAHEKNVRIAWLAVLSAIIAVLTVMCNFVRFGPFPITLALAPIIIGAALFGASAGAFLGGVFGLVVFVTGIMGWDGGTVIYLCSQNFIGCFLICFLKGAAAGWMSGFLYSLLSRHSIKGAVIAAGIACPVTNTLLFIILMSIFFTSTLQSWASGQAMLYYIIFGIVGINFVVEMIVNLVLSTAITGIIKAGLKM